MISPIGMETFEARLQSFNIAHATTKKRTSNAKGAAKLRWPHKSPDPAQLARAGFFYNPKASAPDNTTCYLCHSNLDGWEEEDSAFGEHLNFSPDCGWAVIAQIEQDGDGNLAKRNPTDESLLNARMMTFGANWPHEHKRGWVCKTQKVRSAAMYSDVFAKKFHARWLKEGGTITRHLRATTPLSAVIAA
ncbi:MAG: hypothetical protein L6R39_007490 [Caloplaca ligustica]|nr:MAG: hypothetical protein L6R39_007490 [Caloplaca ligustica]